MSGRCGCSEPATRKFKGVDFTIENPLVVATINDGLDVGMTFGEAMDYARRRGTLEGFVNDEYETNNQGGADQT